MQLAKLSIISGARYYWFRSTTIQNYHHRLKYLIAQLHPTARSIICPWGLSTQGQLGLHDICLAWSILEAGSRQSPELLHINGIHCSLLQPPHQCIAMGVPLVDSTEVMHTPSVYPGFASTISCSLSLYLKHCNPKTIKAGECGGTRIPSNSHICSSTATYMNSSPTSLSSPLLIIIAT